MSSSSPASSARLRSAAGPPSGALQRQEKKADDERAALIADLRKVRPALRAAIAAEAAGITDPDQRTLFAIALDLASGDAGCLREGRQRSEALAELADLKACRDEVLGRIDEKPIHAELRRRRAELVRAAEALAAERAQASTAALDARERAERELGVASGQASEGDAEARAAEAKAASASEADKPAALAAAGQARRRADEKAGERDALRARLEAAKRAETAADQEKAAADAALAKAEAAIDPATVEGFVRLRNRLNSGQALLDNHVTFSGFFSSLETLLPATVRFTTLHISVGAAGKAQLDGTGVARSFNALAAASTAFATDGRIKGAIFSNISINKDGSVSFVLSASLDQRIIAFSP